MFRIPNYISSIALFLTKSNANYKNAHFFNKNAHFISIVSLTIKKNRIEKTCLNQDRFSNGWGGGI